MIRHGYRITLYWQHDDRPVDLFANRLAMFLSALRGVSPSLADWMVATTAGARPISGPQACAAALDAGRDALGEGAHARAFYEVDLWAVAPEPPRTDEPEFLGVPGARWTAPPAKGTRAGELSLIWGMAPVAQLPVWMPNRLELRLHRGIAGQGIATTVSSILKLAVTSFGPEWAVVGTEGRPTPPSLGSNGVPRVGWMTYLCSRFPPLPAIEPPGAVQPIGGGHLITAFDGRYQPPNDAQDAAIEKVRVTLDRAGVLVSGTSLR